MIDSKMDSYECPAPAQYSAHGQGREAVSAQAVPCYRENVRFGAEKLMSDRYPNVVFWSEEDQIWVAEAPNLKSCSAFGSSAEEAVSQLDEAMRAWLETARRHGHALPSPSQPHRLLAAE
jgi:predicted RNase H-like HicB family nuclease